MSPVLKMLWKMPKRLKMTIARFSTWNDYTYFQVTSTNSTAQKNGKSYQKMIFLAKVSFSAFSLKFVGL